MKTIPLTQGKVALVDDEDFDRLSQFKWCVHADYNTYYAVRNAPKLVRKNGKQAVIRMHCQILNVPVGMEVDHSDHNGLNNCRENLRIATHAENLQNQRVQQIRKASQYKGVSWNKYNKKWQSQIRVKGRLTWLGSFDLEIEAAKAYDRAAQQYFGEFACLNGT